MKKKNGESKEIKKSKVVKDHFVIVDRETNPQESDSALVTMRTIDHSSWRLDPARFSSWLRLKRIRARGNRFIYNCKQQKKRD